MNFRPVIWAIIHLAGFSILALTACRRGETEISRPTPVAWQDPPGFPQMLIPKDNPLTLEGIALGRRLFFDPILSADSTISCASCHHPDRFFADSERLSEGINGNRAKRNTLSLVNVGYYYTGLFWLSLIHI